MTNLSKSFCLGDFFPSGFGTDTHEKCCILISEIFPKTHLRLSSVDFFSRGSMPPNPPRTGAYTQFRPRYAPDDCSYNKLSLKDKFVCIVLNFSKLFIISVQFAGVDNHDTTFGS